MLVRRAAIVTLSLLLPIALAGCGDDKDSADSSPTTTAAVTTTADPGTTDQTLAPTTTLSQEEFDAAIAKFNSTIDEAGGDFCKTALAANELNPGIPSTREQVKALYEAFARVLTSSADALPADSGVDPAKLKEAAAGVIADGEAADYDPAKLGSQAPPSLSSADMTATMTGMQELIQKTCASGQ